MGARQTVFYFRGRLGRRGFWIYLAIALPLLAALLVGFWAYALSVPGAYENGGPTPFPSDPPGIAMAVAFFAMLGVILIAGAAAAVRRLHDRDRAWWWFLLLVIIPNFAFGLGDYLDQAGANPPFGAALRLVSAAFLLWGFIELALLRGTLGANRFGPDPRDRLTIDAPPPTSPP